MAIAIVEKNTPNAIAIVEKTLGKVGSPSLINFSLMGIAIVDKLSAERFSNP